MNFRLLLLLLAGCLSFAHAQEYTAYGYANAVAGAKYQMPGITITDAITDGYGEPTIIRGEYFDIANLSGPSLTADTAITFGIFDGSGTDGGGMDIRGNDTKSDANTDQNYTPIRWNGGSKLWRQSGNWVRHTCSFDEGTYNFVYRGNILSYAISKHQFYFSLYDSADMSTPIVDQRFVDLTSMPAQGAIEDNVLRLGGGVSGSNEWFKVLDDIEILKSGTYVLEVGTPYHTYTHTATGVYTFNRAGGYAGVPYSGVTPDATTDTLQIYEYDIVDGTFASDTGVTVGVYNSTDMSIGDNVRAYTDNPVWSAVLYNPTTKAAQANGAWYNYTMSFSGRNPYFFCFRGTPRFGEAAWDGTVQIVEPLSKLVLTEFSLADSVKYISDADVAEDTRWMYISKPQQLPEGDYLVKIDLPATDANGILGEFCFKTEHPTNHIPQFISYEYPQSVRDNDSLYSDMYTVTITHEGQEYDMFMHKSIPDETPSTYPDDNGGNGLWGPLKDRTFNFCQFAYTGEITVEATKLFGTAASRVEIQPKSLGINPFYFDGTKVKFKLKHFEKMPSYISINFVSADNEDAQQYDGQKTVKHGLMIFGDKPEVYLPDTTAPNTLIYSNDVDSTEVVTADLIYFPPGDWNLRDKFVEGKFNLTKNGQHIYVAPGAYVRGGVWSKGHDDIWFYGRGIVTGWDLPFHEFRDSVAQAEGRKYKAAFCKFDGSDNCHIEGLTFIDPVHHTIPTSANTYFKNIKIIGWAYNQDGTRVGAGSYTEQVFMKTQDDRDYADRNHTFKNSILWPMRNGAFGILGWGSYDGGKAIYDNIMFINSEWDRPEENVGNQAVIGSKLKQGSNIANDTIRNIYLEDYTTVLCILRLHYSPNEGDPWNPNDPGEIKEFLFENIKVEQPFISTSGIQKYNRIEGFENAGVKATIHDITFRNLVAGGTLVMPFNKDKYFYIDNNTAYNIFFEAQGDIHTIKTSNNAGGNVYPNGNIAVPDGTNQHVTIEPNAGYRIKDVVIDGTSVGPLTVVNLTDVTSDHTIDVEFEAGNNSFDLVNVVDPNTVLRDDIDLGIDHTVPVNNVPFDNQLLFYPNPATSQVTVNNVSFGTVISIINSVGQRVIQTTNHTIDISQLEKGIYVIQADNKYGKLLIE